MKRWQKIIICILIVLMVLWGGAYGFYKFYFLPKYSQKIITLAEEFLKEENFNPEDLKDVVGNIDIDEITNDEFLKDGKEESENAAPNENKSMPQNNVETSIEKTNKQTNRQINKEFNAETNKKIINEEINEESNKTSNTSTQNLPSGTIGGKSIEDLQKKVDPKDKADGLKIAAKIDIGYLLGLTNGGITEEEKKQAKAHLRARLTDAEYQRLKELVYKYIHLLEE